VSVADVGRALVAVGADALPEPPPATAAPVVLDSGRARIHLGWSPWTPLEEGLSHYLRWRAKAGDVTM
jgi:nucleoside-diphosphate-sugar epimerase